jgi:hypothetical protein
MNFVAPPGCHITNFPILIAKHDVNIIVIIGDGIETLTKEDIMNAFLTAFNTAVSSTDPCGPLVASVDETNRHVSRRWLREEEHIFIPQTQVEVDISVQQHTRSDPTIFHTEEDLDDFIEEFNRLVALQTPNALAFTVTQELLPDI